MNMEMKFNIGDRVRVRDYEELPSMMQYNAIGKIAGKEGYVVDALWSYAKNCTVYKLHLDGYILPSKADFIEGSFDIVEEPTPARYTYEFEHLENLVVARLYEVTEDSKKEIAKGHGHIFHNGVHGFAQAASYALKRIWMDIAEEEES